MHQLGDILVSSHVSLGRCFYAQNSQRTKSVTVGDTDDRFLKLFEAEKQAWESNRYKEHCSKVYVDKCPLKDYRNYKFSGSGLEGQCLICECDVPWRFCQCITSCAEDCENENYLDAPKVCAPYVKHVLQKSYFPAGTGDRSKRVRDLNKDVVRRVCKKLNIRSIRKNDFRKLAKLLDYTEDEIKSLEGEDNPTATILQELATSNQNTVDKLMSLLKEMNRDDVVEIIQNLSHIGNGLSVLEQTGESITMVRQIPYLLRRKICRLLNVKLGDDFRALAGHLGMTTGDIKLVGGSKDPADDVLSWWETQDSATIDKFREILKKMKREDVLELLM